MAKIDTVVDIASFIAQNHKKKRKWMRHSRKKAAELSGVPASTIRRFEDTGEISLRQLLMLCQVYDELTAFKKLFLQPKARTMDELIKISDEGAK